MREGWTREWEGREKAWREKVGLGSGRGGEREGWTRGWEGRGERRLDEGL